MSADKKINRVLVFTNTTSVLEQIGNILGEDDSYELLENTHEPENMTEAVHLLEPNIVLLDFGLEEIPVLDYINDITIEFPKVVIIVIFSQEEIANAQQVILAGARAFIIKPFSKINFLSTLRRLTELQTRGANFVQTNNSSTGVSAIARRTFAVYSPRGGAGCTTLAVNLALSLVESTGEEVLLIDGKQFFGHVDIFLNLRSLNTIADLLPHANNLDEGLIKSVVTRHVSGLNVLLAPNSLTVAQGMRPEDLFSILSSLQKAYSYVVIDVGSNLSENSVTMMDVANKVLLTLTPDIASMRNARQFYEISRTLSYPKDKILLVLNKATSKGGVSSNDIEEALQTEIFAKIPNDDANALRSINRGVPMWMRYSNSPVIKGISAIGKSMVRISKGEVALGSDGEYVQEDLQISSRLG